MKVRCIDNSEGRATLSIGKVYEVDLESSTKYRVLNDIGIVAAYMKDRFEIVEHDNNMQEKTFREVIADIKEGETWVNVIASISYIRLRENGVLDFNVNEGVNLNCKYTLRRKEYTFAEAFKAYEEGKEIESCYSGVTYKLQHGGSDCFGGGQKTSTIAFSEIRGKWYINN